MNVIKEISGRTHSVHTVLLNLVKLRRIVTCFWESSHFRVCV